MTLFKYSRRLQAPRRDARAARGMSLLEIMVTITIIGVVMGMVAVAVIPRLEEAKVDATKGSMRAVLQGLKLYYTRHGKYPDTGQGLAALKSENMLESEPNDAWGNPFVYLNEGGKPTLISYGKDGAAGGDSYDADLNSNTRAEKKN